METLTAEQLKEQGKLIKELIVPLLGDEEWAEILEGTPYLAQAQEIGLAKGQEKVREVEHKAWQMAFKHIRQTLSIRFRTALDQYDKRLKKLKLPVMKKLSDLAFELKTLAEFEAALTKLETLLDEEKPPDETVSIPGT